MNAILIFRKSGFLRNYFIFILLYFFWLKIGKKRTGDCKMENIRFKFFSAAKVISIDFFVGGVLLKSHNR